MKIRIQKKKRKSKRKREQEKKNIREKNTKKVKKCVTNIPGQFETGNPTLS